MIYCGKKPLPAPDQEAWDKILCFTRRRKALRPGIRPYRWNRLDAYEEVPSDPAALQKLRKSK
jgi:hypothetical protein